MTKVKVVPKNVLNPNLYRRAHARVTDTYGPKSSAYRSMAIVKTYKAMGGKYRRRRTTDPAKAKAKAKGGSRWFRICWTPKWSSAALSAAPSADRFDGCPDEPR